ncbi:Dystrophia myotonica WD repeat-containing protein [Heterocephalus glaber]|uniref:Dystrophia myotonica WD repeat-containing protein n=1 Tax=Heterocephalus glaber TaxID=10181 RepID=G5BMY8_HETGA|nr:Dystrophia myotonica WD repeat-containing protein [Heterocephalus glaber]
MSSHYSMNPAGGMRNEGEKPCASASCASGSRPPRPRDWAQEETASASTWAASFISAPAADLNKPIDKRIYKGTQPTCHDFNQFTAATETFSLLVGFSAGQGRYLDLIKKDTSKLFNEERLIDKTKVTYLKWLPESESLFLASHASGHLYLYNVSHPRYVVTGGEDDLVTVWSFTEGRVVARGHGHKSRVNAVAFDPYTTRAEEATAGSGDGAGSGEEVPRAQAGVPRSPRCPRPAPSLTASVQRVRTRSSACGTSRKTGLSRSNSLPHPAGGGKAGGPGAASEPGTPFSIGHFTTLTLQERQDQSCLDPAKVLGTALCPRIHEVPLLEPLVCKKIAQERLTVLLFLEDCIITACQEGLICTWARPGKAGISSQPGNSPSGTVV